ncbi:MAG: TonB-dependent receptor [Dysgonamonadaceae bacterium]|jgi:TonB-linked SusC/RagA family outer membrane protein|nr:TonB-dependent receptor [Dysgonamonadaceae bacterium]
MKKLLVFFLFIFMCFTQSVFAQNNWKISGTVTDAEDGAALIGVSITVEGLAQGTVTDVDGNFSLEVPKEKSVVFSYIGYQKQTIPIRNDIVLNIQLNPDVQMLEEVVAIGYGTMRKSDLTGAVGSISGDKLKIAPVSGVDKALQGRLAGVTVNANSGQPGTDATIRVRGVGTLNGSDPIYVVDGLITDNIRFLSTGDIASLEVLKDASAQAIYGSRGANGVILITTKKGSKGKSNIAFESYIGTQNRWKKLDVMKRDELANILASFAGTKEELDANGLNAWINTYKISGTNTLYPKIKSDAAPDGLDLTLIDTDWQDAVFVKDAMIQNHYLSIDGGDDKAAYMASINYFDQEGTIIGSSYNRLTLRLNTSYQMRKWLKIGENLSFTSSENYNINGNGQHTGMLYSALSMAPWDPIRYPEGTSSVGRKPKDLSGLYATPTLFAEVEHPYNIAYNTKPSNSHIDVVGDVYVEITPLEGLTIRGDVSMKFWNGITRNFTPIQLSTYGGEDHTRVDASMGRTLQLIYEGTATYRKLFAEKHDVTILLGATAENMDYYLVTASGLDLENTDPKNWYVGKTPSTFYNNGTTQAFTRNGGDAVSKDRMASYLSRLQYGFDNRYLLTASLRADGSSRLTRGYYWDLFPSAAAAWKISEEDFFAPLSDIFDFMKIRAGWGRIGNVNSLSVTAALETVTTGEWYVGYPLGTPNAMVEGMSLEAVPAKLVWEKSDQLDMGIDFGIFNNKLYTTIDIFERNTRDMLMGIIPPGNVGYVFNPTGNASTVRNRGIELTLTHQNRINGFNYNVSANMSYIKNKLTALNNGNSLLDWIILQDEGYPLNTIYVWEYDGVFQNQAEVEEHRWTNPETGATQLIQPDVKPGDARYVDRNNDGQITDLDRYNAGNPFPDFTYGLNASMEWKGIDLQIFFQGIAGNEVYNHLRQTFLESSGSTGILSTDMRNVFLAKADPANPGQYINALSGSNGSIPNPTVTGNTNNSLVSSRFVEDASYLRLKDIQLGYTLPKKITSSIGVDRLRFYISATNLLTFTKYKGFDPEVGSNGHDWGNYPQSRNLIFGLNMNF